MSKKGGSSKITTIKKQSGRKVRITETKTDRAIIPPRRPVKPPKEKK